MKYTEEDTRTLIAAHKEGRSIEELSVIFDVPERSIIAKLSSLGLYTRKEYVNKRGEPPVKKEEYLTRIAELLDVSVDILESLEKANKNVLILIEKALKREE